MGVSDKTHPWTKEGTVTRLQESQELTEWMQTVVASDRDLLAEVLRLGLETLVEAERDAYVGAERHERSEARRAQRKRVSTPGVPDPGGDAGAPGAEDPGRGLLPDAVGAVPAFGEGADLRPGGVLHPGRLDPQGGEHLRGAVRGPGEQLRR